MKTKVTSFKVASMAALLLGSSSNPLVKSVAASALSQKEPEKRIRLKIKK